MKKITRDSEISVVELKVPYFESVSAGSHFAIHFLSPHSPSLWPLHHRAPRSTPTKIYSTGQHKTFTMLHNRNKNDSH